MILIVGASGRLGSVVAEHLLAQGKPVRAMTRTPLNLAQLKQQGAEVVSGDLRNPASLLSACLGVEQVLAAAHALVGKGDNNPINFVAVEDVARFVCAVLDDTRAHNRVIEVGGPENLTMNQVAEIFERTSGRQAKKRHVPLPMMRVMSILMQPINPALSRQIRAGIYMDTANLCCDMTETARAFGIQLTPLEELARRVTASAGSFEEMSSEKR